MAIADNQLLSLLPPRDAQRLRAVCEPVDLSLSEVLCESGSPTTHVYFPMGCFVALIAQVDAGSGVEVGMIGREGMLGVELLLGVVASPLLAVVQGAGSALRVRRQDFRVELERSPSLQTLLKRYICVLMSQLAHSAACQRFHLVPARLARWLLMSQDRALADRFHVTQAFLAGMLGVRRVGVTTAAVALQRSGLIEYRRGEVHVLDRAGLEGAACSCYASDKASYAVLLGALAER